MRFKLLMILAAVVILLLCLPACSSSSGLEVDCDEFRANNHCTAKTEVNSGDTFTVTLCSNPSTGFKWQDNAEIGDQAVLQQTGHVYIAPQDRGDKKAMPGASGVEQWTFKALKKGSTIMYVEYGRPWEGGEKGEWTYQLTVVVK